MATILLRTPLLDKQLAELREEFPQFLYHSEREEGPPTPDMWEDIEVLYGDQLAPKEFQHAPLLRWIHVPNPSLEQLCLRELRHGGTPLITNTKDADVHQMGEFALAAILAFSKNLFHWAREEQEPKALWDSSLRASMGRLRDKTLLQIGLGGAGSELARMCKELGMRTWGISGEHPSFHPACHKTFRASDLHSLLPAADIVSLCIPPGELSEFSLAHSQLDLMKEDAILVILGSGGHVKEQDLADFAQKGKFRGILIDVFRQMPLPRSSPLWNLPNVILTPEVAACPQRETDLAYRIFRHNMRRFIHDDFDGMKNLIQGVV